MSNVPEARKLISHALELLYREKPVRPVTRVKSLKVNGERAERIRTYAKRYPRKSLQEIADYFHTNMGRVSEALHRRR